MATTPNERFTIREPKSDYEKQIYFAHQAEDELLRALQEWEVPESYLGGMSYPIVVATRLEEIKACFVRRAALRNLMFKVLGEDAGV